MISRLTFAALALAGSALSPAAEAATSHPESKASYVVHRVKTNDPVVFITIDDGFTVTPGAQRLLSTTPHVNFVLQRPLAQHKTFFAYEHSSGVAFGNHTANHKNLRSLSRRAQEKEICAGRDAVKKLTGSAPTLLRPPFGAWKTSTPAAARACGMTHLVLWNVVADKEQIRTWGNAPIRRGDIILLHYIPSLERSLRKLLAQLEAQGLRPARLEEYLR